MTYYHKCCQLIAWYYEDRSHN